MGEMAFNIYTNDNIYICLKGHCFNIGHVPDLIRKPTFYAK